MGRTTPLIVAKEGEQVQTVQRWWYGAFRHPERRKTSYVKKWLI